MKPLIYPLETDRLLLRPFRQADLAAFVAYRSDPEVARYQSWEAPYTMARAEAVFAALQQFDEDGQDGWYQVAVELKATGEMIGDCAYCILADAPDEAEIGFTLATAFQDRGYAREAVQRLLHYLFHDVGLTVVRANCDVENIRSARLLERMGMQPEGPDKRVWFKGRWSVERWYALIAPSG